MSKIPAPLTGDAETLGGPTAGQKQKEKQNKQSKSKKRREFKKREIVSATPQCYFCGATCHSNELHNEDLNKIDVHIRGDMCIWNGLDIPIESLFDHLMEFDEWNMKFVYSLVSPTIKALYWEAGWGDVVFCPECCDDVRYCVCTDEPLTCVTCNKTFHVHDSRKGRLPKKCFYEGHKFKDVIKVEVDYKETLQCKLDEHFSEMKIKEIVEGKEKEKMEIGGKDVLIGKAEEPDTIPDLEDMGGDTTEQSENAPVEELVKETQAEVLTAKVGDKLKNFDTIENKIVGEPKLISGSAIFYTDETDKPSTVESPTRSNIFGSVFEKTKKLLEFKPKKVISKKLNWWEEDLTARVMSGKETFSIKTSAVPPEHYDQLIYKPGLTLTFPNLTANKFKAKYMEAYAEYWNKNFISRFFSEPPLINGTRKMTNFPEDFETVSVRIIQCYQAFPQDVRVIRNTVNDITDDATYALAEISMYTLYSDKGTFSLHEILTHTKREGLWGWIIGRGISKLSFMKSSQFIVLSPEILYHHTMHLSHIHLEIETVRSAVVTALTGITKINHANTVYIGGNMFHVLDGTAMFAELNTLALRLVRDKANFL